MAHLCVRGSLVFLAVLTAAGRLTAQSDDDRWVRDCERSGSDAREQYCEVRHTGFKPSAGRLTIDPDVNGGVSVEGWDRDSVAISLRIQSGAGSQDEARTLASEITVKASGSTITVSGPSSLRGRLWSANLWIQVPRRTGLSIETTNGPIGVTDVSGAMDLQAQNGPLSLSRLAGDVHARAKNGPLTVDLDGSGWDGKGLDAETINGPVTLRVPEGYNADLETGTVNGPMNLQIPITVTLQGRVTDRIRTTLGKGGAPVRVVTTNGPASILRSRDHTH